MADKRVFRANLAVVWLALNVVLLATFGARGMYDRHLGWALLCVLPAIAAGAWAGDRVHRRLSPAHFRTAVYSLVLAGGLTLLVSG